MYISTNTRFLYVMKFL